MSGSPLYGYVEGTRVTRRLPLAASQTITKGDALTLSSGYIAKAAAGEKVYAVAIDAATSPATAGLVDVHCDISTQSVYRWKSDGAVTVAAHQFRTCDFGGYASDGTPQIDANGTTNDDLYIVECDADLDFVFVQLKPAPAGV